MTYNKFLCNKPPHNSGLKITTCSARVSVGQRCGRGLLRPFCWSSLASLTTPSSQLSEARRPYLWAEWLSAVVTGTLCQSLSGQQVSLIHMWVPKGSKRRQTSSHKHFSGFHLCCCCFIAPNRSHGQAQSHVEEECIPRRWL